jgi:hypothetical protein
VDDSSRVERPEGSPTASVGVGRAPAECEPAPQVMEALFGEAMEKCYAVRVEMDRRRGRTWEPPPPPPEECREWLLALLPLAAPDCIVAPERGDQKHILRSALAASALSELSGVEPELNRARINAVDGLLALARGNGGGFVVMAIGLWLGTIDAGTVTPDVEAWRATVAARFPSSRHRYDQELAFTRRLMATTTPEEVEKGVGDLRAMMASGSRPPGSSDLDQALAHASLAGAKAALASLEQVACTDWTPCLEDLAQLQAEQEGSAKAARKLLVEAAGSPRSFTPEENAAMVALASSSVVEGIARAMRNQEEVLRKAGSRSRP